MPSLICRFSIVDAAEEVCVSAPVIVPGVGLPDTAVTSICNAVVSSVSGTDCKLAPEADDNGGALVWLLAWSLVSLPDVVVAPES